MCLAFIVIIAYWLLPENMPLTTNLLLASIGFIVYGPVMLIGLMALDSVPKKAAGTAAGFTGLFGYLLGSVVASAIAGFVIDYYGWNVYFILLIGSAILSIILMILTLIEERKKFK